MSNRPFTQLYFNNTLTTKPQRGSLKRKKSPLQNKRSAETHFYFCKTIILHKHFPNESKWSQIETKPHPAAGVCRNAQITQLQKKQLEESS